jgi:hypothetical protein
MQRAHTILAGAVRATRLLAMTGLLPGGLAAMVATAPASSAASTGFFIMNGGAATVRSGSHSWRLSVGFIGSSASGAVNIGISAPRLGGDEIHSWDLGTPAGGFSFNATTRTATIKAKMLPVATVDLTFKARSKKRGSCVSGSETVYSGTLTGAVTLHTGFAPEPTLSGRKLSFRGANTLIAGTCAPPTPCEFSSWSVGTPAPKAGPFGAGSRLGTVSRSTHYATIEQTVLLSRPKNAQRTDGAIMTIPAPKFSRAKKSLSITTSSHGIVTGATTISHPGSVRTSARFSCRIGGKRYTERGTMYANATHTSPRGKKLAAHLLLGGKLTVKTPGPGEFVNFTLRKA